LTERFSQYDFRRQKSMTERFGHNDVIALSGHSGDGHPPTQVNHEWFSLAGKNHPTVLFSDQNAGPLSGGYDHHHALWRLGRDSFHP
jgi:hypothetical protein